jgi:hypothetical protein
VRVFVRTQPTFSGGFEPPGSSKIAAYVAEYDRSVDPRWLAAEMRAAKAEETAAQVTAGELIPRLRFDLCLRPRLN